jgi:opacity protein-like surface antigen
MNASACLAAVAAVLVLACPIPAAAQADSNISQPPAGSHRIGIQGFGIVGVNFPAATKSVEATGLDSSPVEVGGGVQVTNVWRDLFAQVTATRTSSSGERAFVDDDGTSFPLGIPLSVKATYLDVSAGWKASAGSSQTTRHLLTYVGGGVGRVRYREESPFAEPDDNLDSSATSYHLLAGVEVGLVKWLGVSVDVRYRYVPNLLGKGGVSAAFKEDDFGGVHVGVGMRLMFGGGNPPRAETPEPLDPAPSVLPGGQGSPRRATDQNSALIINQAPVFLRMDASGEPLRTLEPGTSVKILAEMDDWVRIEFYDRLLGPRVGYVQRKYLRLPKL